MRPERMNGAKLVLQITFSPCDRHVFSRFMWSLAIMIALGETEVFDMSLADAE